MTSQESRVRAVIEQISSDLPDEPFSEATAFAAIRTAYMQGYQDVLTAPPYEDQGRPHSQQERAGSPDRKDDTQ